MVILLAACGKDAANPAATVKALTVSEEALAGKWSRYHAYDGSTDYFIFKTNRTGCKWTEPDGGGRTSSKSFTNWSLDEANPVAPSVYRIVYTYTGSTSPYTSDDEFHYLLDQLWLGGYDNLVNTPSTTSLDCL